MRVLAVCIAAAGATGPAVDPCTQLCKQDGPRVCFKGSWNNRGTCQHYVFRGPATGNDYCYHTAETASTCPSGSPVTVGDVPRLLARQVPQVPQTTTTTETPETTTTTDEPVAFVPTTTTTQNLAGRERALFGRFPVIGEHATQIQVFMESLRPVPGELELWRVQFEDCFGDDHVALVDGTRFTVRDGKVGISADGQRQLALNAADIRANHLRGLEIQQHLANMGTMVVPVYRAEFPGKDIQCSQRYAFEEIYGTRLGNGRDAIITDGMLLDVAARGLEILKELHSLGLVHGLLDGSIFWTPGQVDSIRLRNFKLTKMYFDPRTGQHVPVFGCRGGSRHLGVSCISTVVDLTQYSHILGRLSLGLASADLVAAFKEAVDSLGFAEGFDYDLWISAFRAAV